MSDINAPDGNTVGEVPPIAPYYLRTITFLAATGILIDIDQWQKTGPAEMIAAVLLLSYIYATLLLTKRVDPVNKDRTENLVSMADAGLLGLTLGLVQFSLLPLLMILCIVQLNALLQGVPSPRNWAEKNLAFLIGIILCLIFYPSSRVLDTSIHINVLGLLGVIVYFCVFIAQTSVHRTALIERNQELLTEQEKQRRRSYKLVRYIPPTVWKAINSDQKVKTKRKRLTLFFSDIKDFSQLAEETESETLTDVLNSYLTEMSKIVVAHGGTIDKFMGDGIMVIFGDDEKRSLKQECLKCTSMAIAMRKRMKELQSHWRAQGIPRPLQIRMGINTGYCTVGSFGTSHHMDYTVLGTHVNLASRLESAAEPGEILVSYETWSQIKDVIMCRDKGGIKVKGFSHPIKVFQVIDLRKELGNNQSYFEDDAEGFSMHLDLDKIPNYDRERILRSLEKATNSLKNKVIV